MTTVHVIVKAANPMHDVNDAKGHNRWLSMGIESEVTCLRTHARKVGYTGTAIATITDCETGRTLTVNI